MRLHHLQVTAFGPFADRVDVDLDRLGDAGLFLLSGPTGAGKTSVLDALCFALYGDVPGDRSGAKRLRSDRADPDLPTEVRLEASLAGRRFRFVRSPSWERAKRRGTGTTTAPAKVTVTELVDGTWDPLTSRADEAGDLVGRLLGLTLAQFTQVALLPQGRFATFLRAKSDERHALLQQVFRTGRFEQVERWLRDRRLELTRESARHQDVVSGVVSRVSEAAETALPEPWDPHDLTAPAAGDELVGWTRDLRDRAVDAVSLATARVAAAAAGESASRVDLERTRAAHARADRLARARAEQARLQEDAEQHATDVRRLDAARRAAPVLPLHDELAAARAAVRAADQACGAATSEVAAVLGEIPVDTATTAREAAHDLAAARAALPRSAELHRLEAAEVTLARAVDDLAAEEAEVEQVRPRLDARLEEARTAEADAREAGLLVVTRRGEADELQAAVHAGAEAARVRVEVGAARAAHLDARAVTLDRRDALADLQQARVEGMAAELAVRLAVGGSCPVCGSHDHPAKAGHAPGAPDAAAEREARTAVDDAAAAELAHDDLLRGLQSRLAGLEARAGDAPVEELERRLHAARAVVADLTTRARRHDALVSAREAAQRERELLTDRHRVLAARSAALTEELRATRERHHELGAELGLLLTGTGHPTLEAWAGHLAEVETRCAEALRADAALAAAGTAADAAHARVARAVVEAGFDEVADALAAGLAASAVAALARRVTEHERACAEAEAVLRELAGDGAADPADPAGAGGAVGPEELAEAEHRHARALDTLGAARADAETHRTRTRRLGALLDDLVAACTAWEPVRADLTLTTGLATFCEGRSADNPQRMRLSAYVLAYRLTQVVEAANERLTTMSDQRYRLEHTADRGVGETRGGLSLLVRDDWSGEARDPATLSGGETFVVSLALALGLADVIAHESGGAALETLFVDEGFGSLDADTLDDVMDVLDSLRDGGRVVGVVSHVAEMRDRIPTQLVVTKSRSGSTLAVVG